MSSSQLTPFYRQTRYTSLIKSELDTFIRTKVEVEKFVGNNISITDLEKEVRSFALKYGIQKDEVIIDVKGEPLFSQDVGPGIQLKAKVFPKSHHIDHEAKRLLIQLREKTLELISQKEQLEQIPLRIRNLLINMPYIES